MRITTCLAFFILTLTLATSTLPAAQPPATNPATQVTRLTLRPARTPTPALKYTLLPDAADLAPGNAATLYMTAARLRDSKTIVDILDPPGGPDFITTPIDRFPRERWEELLSNFTETLRYTDLAARRQDVHWDFAHRQLGFGALLPHLNDVKALANLLGVQARFQVAQGDWPAALRTFQTGFAMARHLNSDNAVLIHALIEAGVAEVMINRGLHEWLSREGSPNLYWALSALPHPFVDLATVARWEQGSIAFTNPALALAFKDQLPPGHWPAALREMVRIQHVQMSGPSAPPITPDELAARADRLTESSLPRARQYLADAGLPREKLDAMSPAQAVGSYFTHEYRAVSDDLWKGWELPYAQSATHMRRAQDRLIDRQKQPPTNPLVATAPHVWRARLALAHLDRAIAMLRAIEALRHHAARHDGRPPTTLTDITDLPIPMDPVTGKPFDYRSDGPTATLEAPSHEGSRGRRYELTFIR